MWPITMTSHERHVVSLNCLFNNFCKPTSKKHQSARYWSFVRGIHRWPVNSGHKWPVSRRKLPFDDVIMPRDPWRLRYVIANIDFQLLPNRLPPKTSWYDLCHTFEVMTSFLFSERVELPVSREIWLMRIWKRLNGRKITKTQHLQVTNDNYRSHVDLAELTL